MDTGFKNPVTVESTGNWTNCTVANLNSSNNARAALGWNNSPSTFVLSDFDFQLPDNINILGIEVTIERRSDSSGQNVRLDAELSWNDGSNYTTKKNGTNYSSRTDAVQTLGGAADLWGRSWTKDEFAVGTFRLRVTGNAISTFGGSQVDHVQVKVYYENQDIAPIPTLNTADNTEFNDDTPTLEMTADDESSSDLIYEVQIDTANTFDSQSGSPLLSKVSDTDSGFVNTVSGGDTSPFNNNEKISFTVQAGDELPVGTYYWRSRAKDVSGTNAFGDWSETRTIHVYAVDKEVSKVSIDAIPTDTNHPYADGAKALTATEVTNIDSDNATRVAQVGTNTLYPLFLLKRKLNAGAGFLLDFDGQVDLEAALGTIAFDAASNSANFNNTTPWQWNHTVGSGSNRVLVVVLQIWSGGGTPGSATGVTYNGDAMTLAKRQAGTDRAVEIWVLANPDSGTHQISATLSANAYGSGGGVSYEDVDQTTPVNTTGGGAGTSQNSSQSITPSVNGCEIISGVAGSQSTYSPGNGETERGEGSSTGIVRQFQTYSQTTAAARTVTHNNAYITTQYHVQAIIALQPASVAPSIKIDLWNFDTSSWDNVYEQTSPTADTDFTTQIDKNTGYEDYVDGSGWIIGRVYAEYFDVTLSVDLFTIEVSGVQTNSERDARLTGVATANSERDAKLTGNLTANSERGAKTEGVETETDERDAKIHGTAETSSERGAKLKGGINVDDERAARLTGGIEQNSERGARTYGAYRSPQYLYWSKINAGSNLIDEVVVYEKDVTTPGGSSIAWHVSPDGGANWEAVTAGTVHTLVNAGNDLRLRATLTRSTDKLQGPTLDRISIVWTERESTALSSERAAKLTGGLAANSERSAILYGKDATSSERGAKITGTDTANSERGAVTRGSIDVTSERGAKTHGIDTTSAERDAKITGKDTANSERDAKIVGKVSTDSERGAKTHGTAQITSERAGHLFGKDTTESERDAKTAGKIATNSERDARLIGTAQTTAERDAKITGTDTATDERDAKLTGTFSANDERGAKIHGQDDIASERGGKIRGKDTITSERDAKIEGTLDQNSERDAVIRGQTTSADERSAVIRGKVTTTGERGAKIHGTDTIADEIEAVLRGKLATYSEILGKIHGKTTISGEIDAVITGQDTTADEIFAHLFGKDTLSDERSAKLRGVFSASSERGARLRGRADISQPIYVPIRRDGLTIGSQDDGISLPSGEEGLELKSNQSGANMGGGNSIDL